MKTLNRVDLKTVEEFLEKGDLEILEFEYGCLMDNFFCTTGTYCVLAIETALNCWSSTYTVYVGTYDECLEKWESLGFAA